MAKAIIKGYGKTVEFDPMDYGNNQYDLYDILIVDPDNNWEVTYEERYTDESEYRSALRNTYGREVMHEKTETDSHCEAICNGELYECECTRTTAYVIDTKED